MVGRRQTAAHVSNPDDVRHGRSERIQHGRAIKGETLTGGAAADLGEGLTLTAQRTDAPFDLGIGVGVEGGRQVGEGRYRDALQPDRRREIGRMHLLAVEGAPGVIGARRGGEQGLDTAPRRAEPQGLGRAPPSLDEPGQNGGSDTGGPGDGENGGE